MSKKTIKFTNKTFELSKASTQETGKSIKFCCNLLPFACTDAVQYNDIGVTQPEQEHLLWCVFTKNTFLTMTPLQYYNFTDSLDFLIVAACNYACVLQSLYLMSLKWCRNMFI